MKKVIITALAATVLSACTNNQNLNTAIAGLAGAAIGGVAGHQINDDNGRYVGAAVGALAGVALNNYMNQQQQQLTQQVSNAGVEVNRVDESTIKLNIQSEILFDLNQAQIKQNFFYTLDQIAQVLVQYPQTIVHVYGFTDGSGAPEHNQMLSEQRANNTAGYLNSRGVASDRLFVRGLGERYATAERNPADRRVEIYIRAIEQNNPQSAYQAIYQ